MLPSRGEENNCSVTHNLFELYPLPALSIRRATNWTGCFDGTKYFGF